MFYKVNGKRVVNSKDFSASWWVNAIDPEDAKRKVVIREAESALHGIKPINHIGVFAPDNVVVIEYQAGDLVTVIAKEAYKGDIRHEV